MGVSLWKRKELKWRQEAYICKDKNIQQNKNSAALLIPIMKYSMIDLWPYPDLILDDL